MNPPDGSILSSGPAWRMLPDAWRIPERLFLGANHYFEVVELDTTLATAAGIPLVALYLLTPEQLAILGRSVTTAPDAWRMPEPDLPGLNHYFDTVEIDTTAANEIETPLVRLYLLTSEEVSVLEQHANATP